MDEGSTWDFGPVARQSPLITRTGTASPCPLPRSRPDKSQDGLALFGRHLGQGLQVGEESAVCACRAMD